MFGLGHFELILIAVVVVVLFGAGRISGLMGDVGKGVRSFKKGLNGEDEAPKVEEKKEDNK